MFPSIIRFSIIAVIAIATMVGCQRKDLISWHLAQPLPASAKLVNSSSKMYGPDTNDGFEFEVTDRKLLDLLISEWNLKPVDELGSIFSEDGPDWWPKQEQLDRMNLKYEFFDEENQVYKRVWAEQQGNKVYVEAGDW